jgi:hypothetical protein
MTLRMQLRMTRGSWALAGLLLACAGPAEEPSASDGERVAAAPSPVQQPVTAAQATAGKPLVHVWKSPT